MIGRVDRRIRIEQPFCSFLLLMNDGGVQGRTSGWISLFGGGGLFGKEPDHFFHIPRLHSFMQTQIGLESPGADLFS